MCMIPSIKVCIICCIPALSVVVMTVLSLRLCGEATGGSTLLSSRGSGHQRGYTSEQHQQPQQPLET